ncbi:unnamed protein product [Parascedosporium putredinis]|uniref:SMP-30/Gluconolactonase/LRE-like region domain-containing protein n=1 Tax=Parascedosporium putredinis TaxID=1442378 RepID=A0A9P1GX93_9PEZI|nr:unnamed protein product [Parascedosporium putredinis]CAI7989576.1 unnamed protein product [Parascedosporium putredinis]
MVSIRTILGAVPYIVSVSAASIAARQGAAATQVVNLASLENIAVRPNGQILVTNMNSPNLYAVDPAAKSSSTAVVVTGASGLSGVREAIAEASNLNGLASFDDDSVLVADAGKGNVYRFSMSTGDYSVVLEDPTMAPSGAIPFGIDGILHVNGTVWYTNIFKNSFHKIDVDETGKATGAVTTLWSNLMGDDLCVGPDGKIYVATNSPNTVVSVDATAGAGASPATVGQVRGSTACAFGRGESDANTVYVTGAQGVFSINIGA